VRNPKNGNVRRDRYLKLARSHQISKRDGARAFAYALIAGGAVIVLTNLTSLPDIVRYWHSYLFGGKGTEFSWREVAFFTNMLSGWASLLAATVVLRRPRRVLPVAIWMTATCSV
jgi:hypothetical protein